MNNLPKLPRRWLAPLLGLVALVLLSSCDSSPSYSNIYGPDYNQPTYNNYYYGPGFYDPWYGGPYHGGGVVIVTPPPHHPVHPIAPLPRPMPR